jgi:hypothetical protein
MSTVTYKKQPAIHKTRGSVPLAGTAHLYTVKDVLWPSEVEAFLKTRLIGTTLHVCSGHSQLGDIRLDYDLDVYPDVRGDMARLPFPDKSFDSVLIDPPYNSVFQVMHDMLNELHRVARRRILFQHWFSPINKWGQFKKANRFELRELTAVIDPGFEKNTGLTYQFREDPKSENFILVEKYAWQPRTYFGRMQFISIFDIEPENKIEVNGYRQLSFTY